MGVSGAVGIRAWKTTLTLASTSRSQLHFSFAEFTKHGAGNMKMDASRDLCFYLQREDESQTHWFQIKIFQDKGCDWPNMVLEPTPKTNCCGHNSCQICATWSEGMFYQKKGIFFWQGKLKIQITLSLLGQGHLQSCLLLLDQAPTNGLLSVARVPVCCDTAWCQAWHDVWRELFSRALWSRQAFKVFSKLDGVVRRPIIQMQTQIHI